MSTDAFSRLAFPALHPRAHEPRAAEARSRGHALGYAAGLLEGRKQVEERLSRFDRDSEAQAQRLRDQAERAVAALNSAAEALQTRLAAVAGADFRAIATMAVELAEAVIGCELKDSTRAAVAAVERTLQAAGGDEIVTMRMHPDDLACLDDDRRDECAIAFLADAALQRGDAIAELGEGHIDSRISAAVERVRAALLEET